MANDAVLLIYAASLTAVALLFAWHAVTLATTKPACEELTATAGEVTEHEYWTPLFRSPRLVFRLGAERLYVATPFTRRVAASLERSGQVVAHYCLTDESPARTWRFAARGEALLSVQEQRRMALQDAVAAASTALVGFALSAITWFSIRRHS